MVVGVYCRREAYKIEYFGSYLSAGTPLAASENQLGCFLDLVPYGAANIRYGFKHFARPTGGP